MSDDELRLRKEALEFVLTFARPPDLALSADEAVWRDHAERQETRARQGERVTLEQLVAERDELAARLGLSERVASEVDRLERRDAESAPEQALVDLRDDLVRIFGDELGGGEALISSEGWPVIRTSDRVYFRSGGPLSTFACHRKVGDRIEATLWNRAGVRADRQLIDPPPDGGLFAD